MANTILFKRGPKATIPVGQAGEPLYATDTKEIFVGNGVTNIAVVSTDGTQSLTNKTIDSDLNTISNLTDANLKAGAAIDATKIADGTVTNAEFQYIGGLTSDAQTQFNTQATNLNNHIIDATDAHAGTAITNIPANGIVATTSQAAIDELQTNSLAHINSLTAHTAANIVNVPTGNLTATNIQAAVDEIQLDVDSRIPSIEKGAANGVATLDAGGKVPATQLPNSVMEYKGNFDAALNSPDLSLLPNNLGDVWRVSVAGSQPYIEGGVALSVGDFVIYGIAGFERSINSNEVVSVNGYKGVVVLTKSDVGLGNVDNTSDVNKPVSTAQATAINAVQTNLDNHINDTIAAHSSSAINTNSAAFTGILGVAEDDVQKALAKLSTDSVVKVSQDIPLTNFNIANNQAVMTDITGFLFDPLQVRSFEALVSVYVDATSKLYESFKIQGLNKDTGWVTSIDSIGDDSGVWFDVTNAGQVQYTSKTYAGYVSGKMSFRAIITHI